MNIIFLDVDGVMNSELYHRSLTTKKKGWRCFDPESVKMVMKLVEEFNAQIVISSLWRFVAKKELATELKESHLVSFLHPDWKTPIIEPGHRGKEIKLWLDKHPEIKDFIIIDDDNDVLDEHRSRFVKTHYYDGMQAEHYYKAREIFEVE